MEVESNTIPFDLFYMEVEFDRSTSIWHQGCQNRVARFKIAVRAGLLPYFKYKLEIVCNCNKNLTIKKFKKVSKFDAKKFIWQIIMNDNNDCNIITLNTQILQ